MIEDEGHGPFVPPDADPGAWSPPPLPVADPDPVADPHFVTDPGRIPWEDPGRGFPANLGATLAESLAGPAGFFRRIDPGVPFSRPLLYYLVVSVTGALFSTLWTVSGGGPGIPPEMADALGYGGLGDPTARGWVLLEFFLSPFLALLGLAIWTVLIHPFCRLFANSRRPISETARVLCYATGPAVLSIVPWIGGYAATAGILVLTVIGLRERHRTTTGRAVAAVLVPLIGVTFLLVALILFSLAVLGSLGDLAVP
jgi:hypothetical protein